MFTCFSAASASCSHFQCNPETTAFCPHLSCGFCHSLLSRTLPLGLVSMEICLWGREVYLPEVNHKGPLPRCEEVPKGRGAGREWPLLLWEANTPRACPILRLRWGDGFENSTQDRSKLTGSPCHPESRMPTAHAPGPESLLFWE